MWERFAYGNLRAVCGLVESAGPNNRVDCILLQCHPLTLRASWQLRFDVESLWSSAAVTTCRRRFPVAKARLMTTKTKTAPTRKAELGPYAEQFSGVLDAHPKDYHTGAARAMRLRTLTEACNEAYAAQLVAQDAAKAASSNQRERYLQFGASAPIGRRAAPPRR